MLLSVFVHTHIMLLQVLLSGDLPWNKIAILRSSTVARYS